MSKQPFESLTGHGFNPAYEDMNMMQPPVICWRIMDAAALAKRNVDFTFTSNIFSHALSEHSKMGPTAGLTAAFETRISILPNWCKAASNNCCRSSASATWHRTPITSFQPFWWSNSSAAVTLTCFRLLITTFAPSLSIRSAAESAILLRTK